MLSKLFRSVHTSFRHLALLLAIAALRSGAQPRAGAAQKKDKRPIIIAPPPAMPQKVTVPRGRKFDVALRIYGRQREQLRHLSDQAGFSIVSYEPRADLAVTSERRGCSPW